MNAGVRWRLSGMMAVLYAVQGAWWPLLAIHLSDLGIPGDQRGWIFATLALASMAMPLGAGQLVDCLMATQRYMALACALATGLLVAMAMGWVQGAFPLFLLFLAYWLIMAPSYGLSNSLAMRNLPRPSQQFGGVRLWGTAGWMAVGWMVSGVMVWTGSTRAGQGAFEAFWIGAGFSAFMAVFALTLPHTPPLARESASRGLGPALTLVRDPVVGVYLLAAFGVSMTTPFIYQVLPNYLEFAGLPRSWIASAMTIGQVPEILALAALPWLIGRIGYKGTLLVGIGAWFVRYASLALEPPLWLGIAGIPLHGVGIACATVGGQVFIDSRAPAERRASVQALHMVVTSGLGSFVGSLLAGRLAVAVGGPHGAVFLVPCLINGLLLVYVYLGFHPHASTPIRAPFTNCARPTARELSHGAIVRMGSLATESADG